jgi:2-polyprenyl-6-methoxyphenol hydroxylase-like FAD-dependent oxidoreductase
MNDVIIAGAGPNGLMLACELAMAGVQSVVLDPSAGPNPEPRANGMVGQVVALLDRRGVYERMAGSPGPPSPATGHVFSGFRVDFSGLANNPMYLLKVPQLRIVQVLAARAADLGVDVRWGHALAGFTQDADGVRVQASGREKSGQDGPIVLSGGFLVGADGGHSLTRKLAGIDFPGVSSDATVSRTAYAHVPEAWVDSATGALDVPGFGRVPPLLHYRTEHGVFVWAPFPDRAPLIATLEWDRPADEDAPMTLEELRASIGRVLRADVPLSEPTGDGPRLLRRVVGANSRLASRFREDRVLLLGDAAHVHSAIGGPGLNLGLQDAVNLGWKLAGVVHGWIDATLLDTYESERRPVSERVLMHTRAQSALIAPGSEVTALRELFAELLRDPHTVQYIADLLSGADIRYPAAPGAHPLVGRWVPDFTINTSEGARRLAELSHDAQPLLVDLTTDGAITRMIDGRPDRIAVIAGRPVGEVAASALLVRPDGYVAWASSERRPDTAELDAATRKWFGVSLIDQSHAAAKTG